jgi:hypothetical protein
MIRWLSEWTLTLMALSLPTLVTVALWLALTSL